MIYLCRVNVNKEEELVITQLDPIKILTALHSSSGGLSADVGDAYLKEVYEGRRYWRAESTLESCTKNT